MQKKKWEIRKEEDKDWIDKMVDGAEKDDGRRSRVKKIKKSLKNVKTSAFWRNFAFAILSLVWVGLALTVTSLVFKWLFNQILPSNVLTTALAQGIFTFVVDGVSLLLIIFVPMKFPVWKDEFSQKVNKNNRNRKILGETIVKDEAGFKKEKKNLRESLGLTGSLTWTDIGLAPVGFALYLLLSIASQWVLPFIDWEQNQDIGYDLSALFGQDLIIIFIAVVIIAPIAEEVIFRGWLYGKIRSRLPIWLAAILVSILFGIMHKQINVGVNVFFLSLVLCFMREMTGTIYSGILLHMLKNGIALAMLMYVRGGGLS